MKLQIILIVLVIFGLGYYWYKKDKSTKPSSITGINKQACCRKYKRVVIKNGDPIPLSIVTSVISPESQSVLLTKGGIVVNSMAKTLSNGNVLNLLSKDVIYTSLSISADSEVVLEGFVIVANDEINNKFFNMSYNVHKSAILICDETCSI